MLKRFRWLGWILLLAAIPAGWWLWHATKTVDRYSQIDEAGPADVIIVLGAAEYHGRPSPVLKARLDHALELYHRGFASHILTTGGSGGDPLFTESEVGRTYLSKHGVPVEAIIIENESASTAQAAAAAAEILRRMNLNSCIVVSDGYHIFRAKRMFEELGMKAYGSPRPSENEAGWQHQWRCFRQAVGYGLWTMGIRI